MFFCLINVHNLIFFVAKKMEHLYKHKKMEILVPHTSLRRITMYRHIWNAQEETRPLSRFHLPIKYYHTTIHETNACNSTEKCCLAVKKIQEDQMTKEGLPDIAYNFLVDGLGNVYEGTGWYTQTIPHGKEYLSICLFGISDYKNPPKKFVDGLQSILEFGKEIGYLSSTVQPLLNLNKTTENIMNTKKHQDWEEKFFKTTDDLNEDKIESSKVTPDVDWSQIFPNRGNKTAFDTIVSDKKVIVEKSNWSKVFRDQDQVTSLDWFSLIRNNEIRDFNWSEIFDNDEVNTSNIQSFFRSRRSRVNSKLSHNNNW
ncbi:uncharacterized protein [Chelonus insularis]|uniref:uncharacterized protein n=1 Tax=Chelonus insularis TaxID=460826 RepID=UPI00158A0859|nr:uncharacterized protein LOC118068757 [Chelonus insularis]